MSRVPLLVSPDSGRVLPDVPVVTAPVRGSAAALYATYVERCAAEGLVPLSPSGWETCRHPLSEIRVAQAWWELIADRSGNEWKRRPKSPRRRPARARRVA